MILAKQHSCLYSLSSCRVDILLYHTIPIVPFLLTSLCTSSDGCRSKHLLVALLVSNRLASPNKRHRRNSTQQPGCLSGDVRVLSNEVVRELSKSNLSATLFPCIDSLSTYARLEWHNALQVLNLLVRQLDLKSLEVRLQVLDLSASDDREDVGCFRHHVGKSDGGRRFEAVLIGDFLERFRHLDFVLILALAENATQAFVGSGAALQFLLRLELASADGIPGREG